MMRDPLASSDMIAARRYAYAKAAARATDLEPVIGELRAAGVSSARGLAKALQSRGISQPRGGESWSAAQVVRLLARIDPQPGAWRK